MSLFSSYVVFCLPSQPLWALERLPEAKLSADGYSVTRRLDLWYYSSYNSIGSSETNERKCLVSTTYSTSESERAAWVTATRELASPPCHTFQLVACIDCVRLREILRKFYSKIYHSRAHHAPKNIQRANTRPTIEYGISSCLLCTIYCLPFQQVKWRVVALVLRIFST